MSIAHRQQSHSLKKAITAQQTAPALSAQRGGWFHRRLSCSGRAKKISPWRSLGESNPCFRRERAASWTARRRERRARAYKRGAVFHASGCPGSGHMRRGKVSAAEGAEILGRGLAVEGVVWP